MQPLWQNDAPECRQRYGSNFTSRPHPRLGKLPTWLHSHLPTILRLSRQNPASHPGFQHRAPTYHLRNLPHRQLSLTKPSNPPSKPPSELAYPHLKFLIESAHLFSAPKGYRHTLSPSNLRPPSTLTTKCSPRIYHTTPQHEILPSSILSPSRLHLLTIQPSNHPHCQPPNHHHHHHHHQQQDIRVSVKSNATSSNVCVTHLSIGSLVLPRIYICH